MIQNILTFCVKNDLTFVEGSIPSGKLVANDINRNSIYLVTPYDESIVKANFQTNLQSDTPTSALGILVNGKITIDEIVPTSKSYYNLVKDWNIYEFKVPSTTLSFISRNRTGKIGINFSIEQRLVPTIKDSYGEYQGEILSQVQSLTESGYYINKTIEFELDTGEDVFIYNLNDILVLTKRESPLEDIQVKISAYSNRGSTPTTLYSVDPSLLNDNFETIKPGLTQQIVQQVNDNTGDIVLLFQNVGVNNDTLVDLENRVSVAEQDIDTAEANITNLQGRMTTAESDIDDIEDGTTIVEKALRDSLGNVIKDSYVSAVYPTYNTTTDKLFIETYGVGDVLFANNEVILPKATTTKNGLLSKADYALLHGMKSGDEIVGKALKDEANRNIADTYTKHISLSYNQPSRQLNIGLFNGKNIKTNDYSINLPLATQALSGLMSTTDKTRLDNLWDILQNGDDQSFVDTIHEMLEIFSNYPEGVDIIAKFAEKADKTTTINSKPLSSNVNLDADDIPFEEGKSIKDKIDDGAEYIQVNDLDTASTEKMMLVIENGLPILRIQ